MTARAVTALAVAAMAGGAPAAAHDHGAHPEPTGGGAAVVDMPGRLFSPPRLTVLTGTTVTWRNGDTTTHDVVADDGAFRSGAIAPGASFSQSFDAAGRHSYLCRIHRSMRGVLEVTALGLWGPAEPVHAGETVELRALVRPGTPAVALERLADGPPQPAGEATPDASGNAVFAVSADAPGRYRARAGDETSAVVAVRPMPHVTMRGRRRGGLVRLRIATHPEQPGATVEIGRYVRERFDYRGLRRIRLGEAGTATAAVRVRRRVRLRAELVRALPGWARSVSAPVLF